MLQTLDLTNNQLTGTVPSSIGLLANLQTMDLTGNSGLSLSTGTPVNVKRLAIEAGTVIGAAALLALCIVFPTARRRRRRLFAAATTAAQLKERGLAEVQPCESSKTGRRKSLEASQGKVQESYDALVKGWWARIDLALLALGGAPRPTRAQRVAPDPEAKEGSADQLSHEEQGLRVGRARRLRLLLLVQSGLEVFDIYGAHSTCATAPVVWHARPANVCAERASGPSRPR